MITYYLTLKGESKDRVIRIKFFTKLILIILQVIERISFLVSAITGAVVIVSLMRGDFTFNIIYTGRLIIYLSAELIATAIYKFKSDYYTKANNLWWELDKHNNIIKSQIDNLKIKSLRKPLKNFLSKLSDYYVYTSYLVIVIVSLIIIATSIGFSIPLIAWILLNLLFYLFLKILREVIIYNRKAFATNNNFYISLIYKILFKSKIITTNKLKLIITPFCICSLGISLYFLLPFANVDINKTIIVLFGIRQILSSIRTIQLALMTKYQ